VLVEDFEDGGEVRGVDDGGVLEELGEDEAVFDAETGTGAVVGGCGVGCVAGDGDAAFRECWDGVVAEVEDCPLCKTPD
jgi:hypothetical protein